MKGKMEIFKQSKIQIISLISLVAMILLLILGGNIAKADDVSSSSSSSTNETSSSVVVKSQDSSNVHVKQVVLLLVPTVPVAYRQLVEVLVQFREMLLQKQIRKSTW